MNAPLAPLFACLPVSILFAACARAPAAETAPEPVEEIAKSYQKLVLVTAEPVWVNPELAILCRGASQAEVEEARKVQGPHANARVQIYMNASAARTFAEGKKASYEVGAVIVKEKAPGYHWDPVTGRRIRSANDGVGGMVKRAPGYDPAHGDWQYFYFEDPSAIETGRIASCVNCHAGAKATDHVFGTWATRKGSVMQQAAEVLKARQSEKAQAAKP